MTSTTTMTTVFSDGFFTQGQSIALKDLVSPKEIELMSQKLHHYDSDLDFSWLVEQRVQAMAHRVQAKLFELESDHVLTIHQNGVCHVYIAGCDGPFFQEFVCDWIGDGRVPRLDLDLSSKT